jgi:MtN3 and saliva related transmembrane protein
MIELQIIGLFAGLLTTGSQIPQAIKVYKTKSTGDLSGIYICILLAGTVVWLCYGLFIGDLPLILWNSISIITLGYIATQKYRDIGPQYYNRLLSGPFAIIKTKTDCISTQSPNENR